MAFSAPETSAYAIAATGNNFATAAQLDAFTDTNIVEVTSTAPNQGLIIPDAPIGTYFELHPASLPDAPYLYLANGSTFVTPGSYAGTQVRHLRRLIGGWTFW